MANAPRGPPTGEVDRDPGDMEAGVSVTEKLVAYGQRVELVKEAFNRLGRGAQQTAAFDVRVSPSMVSAVLSLRAVNEGVLGQLEVWLADRYTPLEPGQSLEAQ